MVSFASTVTDPVAYPARELFARAPGARLYGLYIFAELAPHPDGSSDLRRLADLIAAGRLDPQIDLIDSWSERRRRDRGAARPPGRRAKRS